MLQENPIQKKEIKISCHGIQENSQQLIVPCLTESDTRQNLDSTSYISFPEIDDSLKHSCQSLCDQEGTWDCQFNFSSYHSTSEFFLQEEASHF